MVQLIVGEKGKGKTKVLLDKVNTEVKEAREHWYIWIKAENICMS